MRLYWVCYYYIIVFADAKIYYDTNLLSSTKFKLSEAFPSIYSFSCFLPPVADARIYYDTNLLSGTKSLNYQKCDTILKYLFIFLFSSPGCILSN